MQSNTMLNLILMGRGGDVVRTFSSSIAELTQTCQSEIAEIKRRIDEYRSQQEGKKKLSSRPSHEDQSDRSGDQEAPKEP